MYKHVQESLTEYSTLKSIMGLVKMSRVNEAKEDKPEKGENPKDKFTKKPSKSEKPVDKSEKEGLSDIKSAIKIAADNWKSFQTASQDDMLAYKMFWEASEQLKSKISGAANAFRLFGSLKKDKNGKIAYVPGNFSIVTTGDKVMIINHDKSAFEGKSVILEIPGGQAKMQFDEFMKNLKTATQAAKEKYVQTVGKKKKEDVFNAMKKGLPKKAAVPGFDKGGKNIGESGEDKKKAGFPKKGEKAEDTKDKKSGESEGGEKKKFPFLKKKAIKESLGLKESTFQFYDEIYNSLLHMGYNDEEADFIMGDYDGETGSPEEVAEILISKAMGELK